MKQATPSNLYGDIASLLETPFQFPYLATNSFVPYISVSLRCAVEEACFALSETLPWHDGVNAAGYDRAGRVLQSEIGQVP